MNIFIKKITVFIFIISLSIFTLNYLYVNSNGFKKSLAIERFSKKEFPTNIKIANFGSSHGEYGFDYSEIELNGFNFALSSQSLFYDLQILKKYLSNISENGIILIPISYFSLTSQEVGFETDMPRYYNLLEKNSIHNYSLIKDFKYRMFPIFTAKSGIRYIIKDTNNINDNFLKIKNVYEKNSLEEIGEKRAFYHLDYREKNITEKGELELINQNLKNINEIVRISKQKNICVVLITTPFTGYYNKHFSQLWLENNFYSHINKIVKENNINYLDYSHDERFQNEFDLFNDTDHLNLIGRKKFTKIVIEDLKTTGIIK